MKCFLRTVRLLVFFGVSLGWSLVPLRADEAATAAGKLKATQLMAEAEKLFPQLSSTSNMPNLTEARQQAEARKQIEKLYGDAVAAAPTYWAPYLARAKFRKVWADDWYGAEDDVKVALQLAPRQPEVWAEFVLLSERGDQKERKKLAAKAYSEMTADAAKSASPPSLALAQLAFYAEQWPAVVVLASRALQNRGVDRHAEWLRLRGFSYLAMGNEALAQPDLASAEDRAIAEDKVKEANKSGFGGRVAPGRSRAAAAEVYYTAKNPALGAKELYDLARAHAKALGSRSPAMIDILDRAIERDPKMGAAYQQRAELAWRSRDGLLLQKTRHRTLSQASVDYQLLQVYTPEKIEADCAAAVRLGIDKETIYVIRRALAESSEVARFEFNPYPFGKFYSLQKQAEDPKVTDTQLLEIARQARHLAIPQEQRLTLYDAVIKRDPKVGEAHFGRCQLRAELVRELKYLLDRERRDIRERMRSSGEVSRGGMFEETQISGRFADDFKQATDWIFALLDKHRSDSIRGDCDKAEHLGFRSDALKAPANELKVR